jgi:hypothetical protein
MSRIGGVGRGRNARDRRDLARIAVVRGRGTWVAKLLGPALVAACSTMGCLVTDSIDLPADPPVPPSIRIVGEPLVSYDRDGMDAVPRLEFEVRDENVDDTLRWAAYVNLLTGDEGRAAVRGGVLRHTDPRMPAAVRALEGFDVPADLLTEAGTCRKIEVRVSRQFEVAPAFCPSEPDDVAIATWWLAVVDRMVMSVPFGLCPTDSPPESKCNP